MKTFRIVFVGVGGQGNLLASNLLGQAALDSGVPAVVSEIHGMAQRGGVVESAVLLGGARSPIVSTGEADALVAFEPAEALRLLDKAGPKSLVITSLRPVPPFTVTTGQGKYPDPAAAVDYLRGKVARVIAFDGQELAERAMNPLSLNMVMLGALFAGAKLRVPVEAMKKIIRAQTKQRFVEANLLAFDLGYQAAAAA
ncbi:Indolepyruvate ferredoxin oxidoreductase [Desulfarculus baarsii DSM 2075]|uniref:Indolepyruvate ferredoxin oxidoreductase n=1 Tax=Desulfarculus baarsii (strain ATCC 33931 / DSM 2075 / LMG 7858 / VKM B-1802 / 2st14) TaxID=644282 RepID=E1QHS7_DESB2|nr:indolepyruvate oxidoreductase subunit beta [Desulfarculus baarsii]ADK85120.1 Indolepyruvate ferredoxin oxidoreductase [Desulfarculus baarsii DSM 2075]